MDTGDVIEQLSFTLLPEQDVGDALKILYPLYGRISRGVVEYFRAGKLPRRQQDHSQASVFPRRRPEDGRIDWNMPLRSVWNLVRAVAYPYPGAFTAVDGGRLIVWKAAPAAYSTNPPLIPGTVLRCTDGVIHVQCHDDVLMLTSVELIGDGHSDSLSPGVVLGR
jgi:methionyl-tRNA formyltransferase